MNRQCGECEACCIVPALFEEHAPAGPKPAHQRCKFLHNSPCSGCTIYEDRPKVCREYHCAWLLGAGLDKDKPNKSGAMIELPVHEKYLVAHEVWSGAKDEGAFRQAVRRISRQSDRACLVVGGDCLGVSCPKARVQEFMDEHGETLGKS